MRIKRLLQPDNRTLEKTASDSLPASTEPARLVAGRKAMIRASFATGDQQQTHCAQPGHSGSDTRKHGVTLKLNLIGILNYLTVSELIRNSEILKDAVTGDVTIKETVTGNRITALIEPLRSEALRKAILDSVLVTTIYRAGKAVVLPGLECQQVHFALNQNTNQQVMSDYLRWFIALHLLTPQDEATSLNQFIESGSSTCVLRTSFGDADCVSMFFDERGNVREKQYYLEFGRQAMRALLDPDHQTIDHLRYQIVDDKLWPQALDIGANVNLGPLFGLSTADAGVEYFIGDVMVITDWAEAMVKAGTLVHLLCHDCVPKVIIGLSSKDRIFHTIRRTGCATCAAKAGCAPRSTVSLAVTVLP